MPKSYKSRLLHSIFTSSIKRSIREQNLDKLFVKLEELVPDITHQYSKYAIDNKYLNINVRSLHAFQISLVDRVLREMRKATLLDIGDFAGTHLQYISGLYSKDKEIKCVGINLDAKAVEKIRQKGFEAIHARAEDLSEYNTCADILLCFQTLEHLMDPCRFLRQLSHKTEAKFLIVTVPYLRKSRVGLHHIRNRGKESVCAENTHIFEFSPDDWKLLMNHSGWNVLEERVYLQYPRKGILRATKSLWKRFDFEGFYGLILCKDNSWSSLYTDW